MNLQESIRKVLREETSNRTQNKLIDMIKTIGFKKTSKAVGGIDNLKKITGLHNSVVFLNLFSDLERVESEENPEIFLYRYKKGKNVIVVDERDDDMRNVYVYVNYDLIYGPLAIFKESVFYKDKEQILKRWMKNTFDIEAAYMQVDSFQPGSEDYGFWELLN
jgi:hypothetical protein